MGRIELDRTVLRVGFGLEVMGSFRWMWWSAGRDDSFLGWLGWSVGSPASSVSRKMKKISNRIALLTDCTGIFGAQ